MTTTWALAIATYKREDILPTCLELAARQTRPPQEIVVIDATPEPGFTAIRDKVMNELAPRYPDIQWRYDKARVASAASQRNQCIESCESDVLFLFDDDSLMYPRCAERLMQVYDMDTEGAIAGASPMDIPVAPTLGDDGHDDGPSDEVPIPPVGRKKYNPIVKTIRGLLGADDIFVPYDDGFPDKPIPEKIKALGVGRRSLMAGMTMTVRRKYAAAERFDEILKDRGPEDSDMSYRVSRHGALVTVFDSSLHHVGSPGGRFSRFSREALCALGPLVLHRIYSTDLARSKKRSRSMLRRRLIIALLKDLQSKQWSLPQAKGIWFALRQLKRVFAMDEAQLRAWYPDYQKQLIAQRG